MVDLEEMNEMCAALETEASRLGLPYAVMADIRDFRSKVLRRVETARERGKR